MSYADYLRDKAVTDPATGIDVAPQDLNPKLFGWQADITRWALRRGRAAIFADCGLGKTFMQLEWARFVPGRVLIVAPLAVAKQTQQEGEKFGIVCEYDRAGESAADIVTTNYELLDHFAAEDFAGVVLDESSILKAHDGKTRTKLIDKFQQVPYRLCCTATPAPNDHVELGNHAEFLGTMGRGEMLSMFFVHDGGETQKWRLKRHAVSDFWRWVSSWAVMVTKPSDLGYPDTAFTLPPCEVDQVVVPSTRPLSGHLWAEEARGMTERLRARRETIQERAEAAAEMINNGTTGPWVVWCNLNNESTALKNLIPGAVEIRGSDSPEHKESAMLGFAAGDIRVLVTKPRIAGFGMNWQHCHNVAFVGLSDSWEAYYQAVRRCWRFGQDKPVRVHIVTSELEGAVVANIKRKERDALTMRAGMVEHMRDAIGGKLTQARRFKVDYEREHASGDAWDLYLGDCVDVLREMEPDSVHYSAFSPPFASLYTYSATDRDMGNCKDDADFAEHFGFAISELFRVTKPGRLLSFHCMNLPSSKAHHGYIGLRDFRGDMVRLFLDAGWIFHSEVCIWKDPVTAMQRTKALGLLHKQLKKDSCMSRQGIPDYLVTMRKPGDNPEPVTHDNKTFPVQAWQRYASPIWDDINQSDTLQYRSAREHEDERHICPLQLTVIRRALKMWSNEGDLVLSPFAGIGSEGVCALEAGRRFVGIELKRSYWEQAARNLAAARSRELTLF